MKWLVALLKELGEEKVLLICRTRALAEQVSARLQRRDQCEVRGSFTRG